MDRKRMTTNMPILLCFRRFEHWLYFWTRFVHGRAGQRKSKREIFFVADFFHIPLQSSKEETRFPRLERLYIESIRQTQSYAIFFTISNDTTMRSISANRSQSIFQKFWNLNFCAQTHVSYTPLCEMGHRNIKYISHAYMCMCMDFQVVANASGSMMSNVDTNIYFLITHWSQFSPHAHAAYHGTAATKSSKKKKKFSTLIFLCIDTWHTYMWINNINTWM